jgi:hypothetical protein
MCALAQRQPCSEAIGALDRQSLHDGGACCQCVFESCLDHLDIGAPLGGEALPSLVAYDIHFWPGRDHNTVPAIIKTQGSQVHQQLAALQQERQVPHVQRNNQNQP